MVTRPVRFEAASPAHGVHDSIPSQIVLPEALAGGALRDRDAGGFCRGLKASEPLPDGALAWAHARRRPRVLRRHPAVLVHEPPDGFHGTRVTRGIFSLPLPGRPSEYAGLVRKVGTWVHPRGLEPMAFWMPRQTRRRGHGRHAVPARRNLEGRARGTLDDGLRLGVHGCQRGVSAGEQR